ncbi:MAG: transketolase [Bdellovibrionales bacterium RIFOXYD1_FULL_53_11]|nr:MAG: transketolase [Bdellovibrionales bacterium RIFOXYD1_FULL_53_11]
MNARSRELRRAIVETIDKSSRRGHIGAAFSVVEILSVLYDDILRFDPKNPRWHERDRCILSKGHGCLALYAILADKGFFDRSALSGFCMPDGFLGGHPEYHKIPGVEASTGSLGHGLSIGVGFAMSARIDKSPRRTFVILGDGECNEGSVWEAALSAGKHKLSSLTILVDYNKQQSYGTTFEVQDLEPFADKWRAFGFAVRDVDGHDTCALRSALKECPLDPAKPSVLICNTIKGYGSAITCGNLAWHHKTKVTEDEIAALMKSLGEE